MKEVLALALLLAGCTETPGNTRPDAPVTNPTDDAGGNAGPRAVVVSGEFGGTGILSSLDVATLEVHENLSPAGGVSSDPVIRRFGDKVYVINRFGANSVSVYDARSLQFQEQYGTGSGTNPQDLAILGDTMYVVGGSGVIKIKLGTGAMVGVIDLSDDVGDPDGNPDCVTAHAIGDRVFVACNLFDFDVTFAPRGPGKVAVIDTASDDAVSVVTLPEKNPVNFFVQTPASSVFGGDLLIGLTPSYSDYSTGCIARVSTGASPAASCAAGLSNDEVAGVLSHMDVSADGKLLWMSVNTNSADFSVQTGALKGFDLESGTLWTGSISATDYLITDVAACPDGSVIAIDRKMNAAGFRVYKDSQETTTSALSFGLPPLFGNNTLCYDPAAL